jgi:hypothetical protein
MIPAESACPKSKTAPGGPSASIRLVAGARYYDCNPTPKTASAFTQTGGTGVSWSNKSSADPI